MGEHYPFLVGRAAFHLLKLSTDWNTHSWYVKTTNGYSLLPVYYESLSKDDKSIPNTVDKYVNPVVDIFTDEGLKTNNSNGDTVSSLNLMILRLKDFYLFPCLMMLILVARGFKNI